MWRQRFPRRLISLRRREIGRKVLTSKRLQDNKGIWKEGVGVIKGGKSRERTVMG